MKASLALGFIAIALVSCRGSNNAPVLTGATEPSGMHSSPTSTAAASRTSEPLETYQAATETIAPTATPIPGILSHEQLKERVDAWVNGEIPFAEEDRLLDMVTGEPLRLGAVPDPHLDTVLLLFYNLGHTVVDDEEGNQYLVNMAGFEDGAGNRFAFPLYNGILTDACPTIHLEIFEGSRQMNKGKSIYFAILKPLDFAREAGTLQGAIAFVDTMLFRWGEGVDECDKKEYDYYSQGRPVLEALDAFLGCDDCASVLAPDLLKPYMNEVPDHLSQIPYARFYDFR